MLAGAEEVLGVNHLCQNVESKHSVKRGAWQSYQETIWGRRPLHPDRLRSIYTIRVTKRGTRVGGRNVFERVRP